MQALETLRNEGSHPAKPGKFLVFSLGTEEFALPVARIREIIGLQSVTPVPRSATFVMGVTNLRGRVVPVIDLRGKVGAEGTASSQRPCIVVVEPQTPSGGYIVGAVVDAVNDVLNIHESDIEPVRNFNHGLIRANYIEGVAKVRGKVRVLLNVDRLLAPGELQQIAELNAAEVADLSPAGRAN